jgi:small subunit ribosomal protein S16
MELLGHYLPAQKTPVFEVKKERVAYWISKGAHPSNTLARLLKKSGMDGMDKFMERYAKQKPKNEVPVEAPKPAAAPAEAKKEEPAKEAPADKPAT